MSAKTFVDSNVLIYAYDVDAKTKYRIANSVLRELWEHRLGVLSVQVLQEFYVNVTRKIARPIPKSKAQLIVEASSAWCTDTTPAEVSRAFRIENEAKV